MASAPGIMLHASLFSSHSQVAPSRQVPIKVHESVGLDLGLDEEPLP